MSYQVLSSHPSICLVDDFLLGRRLDPRCYHVEYMRTIDSLRASGVSTQPLRCGLAQASFRGRSLAVTSEGRVANIKVRNLTNFGVEPPFDLVCADVVTKNGNCCIRRDDVLLAVTGVGSLGKVDLWDQETDATVDGHVAILRCNASLDAGYLKAFLHSRYGQHQIERYTVGSTGQTELYGAFIDQLEIATPSSRVQTYIGSQIRYAGRCRIEASRLTQSAYSVMLRHWRWEVVSKHLTNIASDRTYVLPAAAIGNRLDAEYYQPHFLRLSEALDSVDCWSLSELVSRITKGVQPQYNDAGTVPALTVTHVDPFQLDVAGATGHVTQEWLDANKKARPCRGEVLVTVTGPPLGESVVVEEFHLPVAVNSHVARVQMRDTSPYPHLLAAMINSDLGRMQTLRSCKGVRQKELYPEDLRSFRFPRIRLSLANTLEKRFRRASLLEARAGSLVAQAKLDVESLVEGTLDIKAIETGRMKSPTWESVKQAVMQELQPSED